MLKKINLKDNTISEIEKILDSRSKKDLSQYRETAQRIIEDVKNRGDRALFEYTAQFDKVKLDGKNIKVSQKEIEAALNKVDQDFLAALKKAAENIKDFHEKQKDNSWQKQERPGKITGQICRPLENAGIYVPGGRAAYPSSVLMTAIPAKVAGVDNIINGNSTGRKGGDKSCNFSCS